MPFRTICKPCECHCEPLANRRAIATMTTMMTALAVLTSMTTNLMLTVLAMLTHATHIGMLVLFTALSRSYTYVHIRRRACAQPRLTLAPKKAHAPRYSLAPKDVRASA